MWCIRTPMLGFTVSSPAPKFTSTQDLPRGPYLEIRVLADVIKKTLYWRRVGPSPVTGVLMRRGRPVLHGRGFRVTGAAGAEHWELT